MEELREKVDQKDSFKKKKLAMYRLNWAGYSE